jgi:hypothetical protein
MKHVITYPGFAESLTARGLYTDMEAEYSPPYNFHILPFYEELENGDRVVHSINEHAETIQNYMDGLDGEIVMISKCGGTRPTVAMDDKYIARLSKLCLINPPWRVSNTFLEYQLAGWGGHKQTDGSWTLPRGDAGRYVITNEYIHDATTTDMIGRFNEIARSDTDLYFVRAMKDEMFPPIRTDKVVGATFIDIEGGDHHLLGEYRQKALAALALNNVL